VAVLLAVPAYYVSALRSGRHNQEIATVVESYVRAAYARDSRGAYRWLSAQDRQNEDEASYLRKEGTFSGFTSILVGRLASFIDIKPAQARLSDHHASVKVKVKLPDADKMSAHFMEWDEGRLNSLSAKEQMDLMARVARWRREGKIPFIEIEQTFELVKETGNWRLLLNRNDGVRVEIRTKLPGSAPLHVEAIPKEIVFQPGEPFTITLKVKNRSDKELWFWVAHNVEPEIMAKYMGLGDCGAFLPFRLSPGKEEENKSTFLIWTDIPETMKQFTMLYEFKVEDS
jgi:hypothetical protein